MLTDSNKMNIQACICYITHMYLLHCPTNNLTHIISILREYIMNIQWTYLCISHMYLKEINSTLNRIADKLISWRITNSLVKELCIINKFDPLSNNIESCMINILLLGSIVNIINSRECCMADKYLIHQDKIHFHIEDNLLNYTFYNLRISSGILDSHQQKGRNQSDIVYK